MPRCYLLWLQSPAWTWSFAAVNLHQRLQMPVHLFHCHLSLSHSMSSFSVSQEQSGSPALCRCSESHASAYCTFIFMSFRWPSVFSLCCCTDHPYVLDLYLILILSLFFHFCGILVWVLQKCFVLTCLVCELDLRPAILFRCSRSCEHVMAVMFSVVRLDGFGPAFSHSLDLS